ncbi:MAG: aminotransferase class I/II-fold pyridoxal phosphate-dependent enzyme [Bacteroidales bacterium]|nr:aminotransferase class I/II-fold pyridoxal phosphate-dependent enzyme [Candidatus Sodaliphilus fimicaballi]
MKKANNNFAITPAQRVSEVKEYYFSSKLKEIAALNAQGADIISLGVGGPDCPPSDEVIETLCTEAHKPDAHGYQPYVGHPALREAYTQWYEKHYGVKIDPATEILPLIGSKEGILHTTLAFVNPGDGVLVPNPGYPTYTSVSRLAGAQIHYYDLTEENGWEPDFNQLEQLASNNIKLMWINYPHMPTGKTASKALFEKLVDFGRRNGIVIVNDNPYSFILNDTPLSIMQVDGARDIAIEMNSLSKSHNMPGWRMGMVTSNATFINWILKVKSNVDSGQYKPMMLAAVKALQCDDTWYESVNATYSTRRRAAEELMKALGCHFDPEQRGLFLWGRIPDNETSAEQYAQHILDKARVFVVPGFIFGSNGNRYIRISLCATEEKIREAIKRVNENK